MQPSGNKLRRRASRSRRRSAQTSRPVVKVVLGVASLLAIVFTIGGAGLYGSPFGGRWTSEETIFAAAILIGPIACVAALVARRKAPVRAGIILVLGSVWGF